MRRAAPSFQNDPRMRGGHGPPPPHLPSRGFVPNNGRAPPPGYQNGPPMHHPHDHLYVDVCTALLFCCCSLFVLFNCLNSLPPPVSFYFFFFLLISNKNFFYALQAFSPSLNNLFLTFLYNNPSLKQLTLQWMARKSTTTT